MFQITEPDVANGATCFRDAVAREALQGIKTIHKSGWMHVGPHATAKLRVVLPPA
jgi:hypothetical protein